MIVLARLLVLAVSLFIFISIFLSDFEEPKNPISYKIYIFIFVFVMNFMFQVFTDLINGVKISINETIEASINNGMLAVIAYGIYGDLKNNNFFTKYNHSQKILIMILLIIGFVTSIKVLECLISSE